MAGKPAYLVLDLETTGLDPRKDVILEFGCILVDADLQEISRFQSLVDSLPDQRKLADDFVQHMHTVNGLWDTLESGEFEVHYPTTVEQDFISWFGQHVARGKPEVVIAGNSIHFDCAFLEQHIPAVLRQLHYRRRDIGQIGMELQECGLPVKWSEPPHRAMADCELELASWRTMRAMLTELRDRKPLAEFRAENCFDW